MKGRLRYVFLTLAMAATALVWGPVQCPAEETNPRATIRTGQPRDYKRVQATREMIKKNMELRKKAAALRAARNAAAKDAKEAPAAPAPQPTEGGTK